MAQAVHPDPSTLVRLALEPGAADAAARAHVRACGACAEEVAGLMAAAGALRLGESVPRGPGCLDEEVVAALAEGSLDADRHAVVLPHLKACPACLSAVGDVAAALASPGIGREIRHLERRRSPWLRRGAAAVAAAVILVLAWPSDDAIEPPHRAVTLSGAVPSAVHPAGAVQGVEDLVWRSATGADLYRVVLFDAAGSVLLETSTADTTVAIPASVRLEPGQSYLWRVDARIGWDRWSSSELLQFSVRTPSSR